MAVFNQEQALKQYSGLMKLIHAGAYSAGDETEQTALDLDYQAAQYGLEFHYHNLDDRYSLEPISAESKAAFLHVNVENLVSILAEASRYLNTFPFESELEKNARLGLLKRVSEVISSSYRLPVLREQEAQEYEDSRKYMEHYYEGGE